MSLIYMGDVAGCLNIQPVILIISAAGGSYNDRGQWVEAGAETEVPDIPANVQPATGRILQFVPEGERTRDHVSVWFTQLVSTTSEALAQKAAKMVYRGFVWKCISVPEDWRENGFVDCLFQNTKEVYTP